MKKVTNLESSKAHVHGKVIIIDNAPSTFVLLIGDVDKVKEDALKALKSGVVILSKIVLIYPMTSLENIKTMIKARDE